ALADPSKPPLKTSTKISADIEVKAPVAVAIGAVAPQPNEPAVDLAIHNLRLTTDDPTAPGKPLDFVSVDELSTSVSALPEPGKPAVIDQVAVTHPVIRAVALAPGSSDFAGIASLQAIAKSMATTQPAPTQPAQKISDLVRLTSLNIAEISLLYSPRIAGTVPMTLDHISTQVALDSAAGDAYRFDVKIPQNVALSGNITGRINVDAMRIDPVNLTLSLACGKDTPTYLPPQVQQLLKPYDMAARVGVSATASASLDNPAGAVASANVMIDDFAATFGDYRIPVVHIRLPVQLKNNQLTILKSDALGGPMVNAFGGSV